MRMRLRRWLGREPSYDGISAAAVLGYAYLRSRGGSGSESVGGTDIGGGLVADGLPPTGRP